MSTVQVLLFFVRFLFCFVFGIAEAAKLINAFQEKKKKSVDIALARSLVRDVTATRSG